jgi:hypothetical protein
MNAAFLDKTNFNKSTYVIREKNYLICIKVFFMVNYMNISLLKSIVNNVYKDITVMSDFFKCFRLTKFFSHSLKNKNMQ